MPGIHKYSTISFRPNTWERAIIEQRAALSGMHKKDFIAQSCMYASIKVEGHQENVQHIYLKKSRLLSAGNGKRIWNWNK